MDCRVKPGNDNGPVEAPVKTHSINRRTLVKTGLGALAAPGILSVIPVNGRTDPA